MPKPKWDRLLRAGSAAATASLGSVDQYFCPICSKAFDISAATVQDLTLEHVPPRAAGGREIILTCRWCNNYAGSTVDAASAKRAQSRELAELLLGRRKGENLPIVLTAFDGTELNAKVSRDEAGFKFRIPHTINDPKKLLTSAERSKVLTSLHRNGGLKLGVRSKVSFSNHAASISHLRSAFLVATAKFGYTFAFSKSLEDVRQQIIQPDKEILSIPFARVRECSSEFHLAVSRELNAALIAIEDRVLVLPWCFTSEAKWNETHSKLTAGVTFNIQAISIPWPTSFEAILDHARAARGPRLSPG